jgi:hypothetical protein
VAHALETLLGDPAEAARRAQGFDFSPHVRTAMENRLDTEVTDQADLDDLLAVHDQGGEQGRVVLVNRSARRRLAVRIDDQVLRLAPFALGTPRAFRYAS